MIQVDVPITMALGLPEMIFGADEISARLRAVGIAASAEVQVSDESWRSTTPNSRWSS